MPIIIGHIIMPPICGPPGIPCIPPPGMPGMQPGIAGRPGGDCGDGCWAATGSAARTSASNTALTPTAAFIIVLITVPLSDEYSPRTPANLMISRHSSSVTRLLACAVRHTRDGALVERSTADGPQSRSKGVDARRHAGRSEDRHHDVGSPGILGEWDQRPRVPERRGRLHG